MALNVSQLIAKLETLVDDVINKEVTDKVGRKVAKTVRERTRKGFGVKANGGRKERLKKLKKPTKKIRQDLKKKGQLSGKTTPNRSNLTRSGRMLDNIGYSASDKEVTIAPKGKEQLKARDVSKDRPFMNLSKTEIKEVTKLVAEEIIKGIRKKGL